MHSRAFVTLFLGLALALGARPAGAQQISREAAMCGDCHSVVHSGQLRSLTHADTISCLTCHHIGYTRDPVLSLERRLEACAGCHEDMADHHVGVGEVAPDCTACHSIHADETPEQAKATISDRCSNCHIAPHPEHAPGAPLAPECGDCHTMHTGRAFEPADPALFQSCVGCHQATHPSHASVEGVAACTECHSVLEPVVRTTVESSELCASCHGAVHPTHEALDEPIACLVCHDFVSDPPLAEAGPAVAERCGTCHEAQLGLVRAGGHGAVPDGQGTRDVPTCLTCHTTHMDVEEARATLKVSSAIACMQCHGESSLAVRYGLPSMVKRSYADDFHGTTVQFLMAEGGTMGGKDVMICADCHGMHDVAPLPESAVAEVCQRCHEQSDERIAGAWLGHETPGPRHKPLIWMVRLFYFVLIPFMLTGLTLSIAFQLLDQRSKGARVMKTEGMRRIIDRLRGRSPAPRETVERFDRSERLEHWGSALTFIGLVVTGIPQTRPDLAIARAVIDALGGIWTTRIIHRTIGVVFVVLMVTHVTRAVVRAVQRKRVPIMVPERKDFEDVLQTFRHYLLREPMPKVGKFDYAEKFEYWGLFLGGVVMSSTGIILMFPELVTQMLPGVIVAATRVMHGMEATMAVLVVILWHSYGVILRPEVFPLDTSIITGRMSVDRLRHEHPLEYERIFPERAAEGHGHEAASPAGEPGGPAPGGAPAE